MTQEQLAKALNVSRYTIIKIESGSNTTDQMVLRIARFFNKDPREIFFDDSVAHNLQNKKSDQEFSKEVI